MAVNANIGTAWISVVPDTSKLTEAIKEALKDTEKSIPKSGSAIGQGLTSSINKTLKVGAGAVGLAAGGIIATSMAKGLGRLNALDQANAKLDGLGYTAEEVTRVMEGVNGAVTGTAFGLDEAAGSAAKLGAVGVETGDALDRSLKLTADIAAQAGTSMDDVSSIMAKIEGSGKVTGETLAQLDDRATGAGAAIADHLNVSIEEMREMVSNGEVSAEDFAAAMEKHIGGAAQKTGETVQGAVKNMGAALGRIGATVQKPLFDAIPAVAGAFGTVFDEVNKAIGPSMSRLGEVITPAFERLGDVIETRLAPFAGELADHFGDLAVKAAEFVVDPALWERVGDIFGNIRDTVERLWPSIQSLAGSFLTIAQNISAATWQALGAALNAIAPLVESVLVPMVEKAAEFAEQNPGAVQAMVMAFLGFKGLSAVAGPVGTVAKTLGTLKGAVTGVSAAFKGATFGQGLLKLMGGAKSANPILAKLGSVVGSVFKAFWQLMPAVAKVGKILGTVIRFINPWVAGFTIVTGALIYFFTKTEMGQRVWESFTTALSDGWQWVQDKVGGGVDWLTEKFTAFTGWISDAFNGIKALFQGDFTSELSNAFGISDDSPIIVGFFKLRDTVQVVGDFLKSAFENIKNVAITTIGVIGAIVLTPFIITWNALSWAISAGYENIIKPTWDLMVSAVMWLWENGIKPVLESISEKWDLLQLLIGKAIFEIRLKIYEFQTAITALWLEYVQPVLDAIRSKWDQLSAAMTAAWNVIKTAVFDAWNAYVNQVKANWDTVTNALNAAWTTLKDHFTSIWNTIKTSVLDAWNTAVNFLKDTFNTITTTISDKWTWLKDQMSNVWSWIRDNVLTKFEQGLDKLKSFFSDVVNGIQIVWNKLRGHLAKPINFMINTVYNDGILRAWNTMADILPGLSPGSRLSGIPEHATGGRISGPGTGTSDDVLMWGSNGEHMLTAEEVKKFGGHDNIYRLRAMLRDNIPFTTNGRGQVVPLPRGIDNKAGDLYGAAPDLLPAYATGGEIRPLWEQQLERGHAFAKAQHGKPYQWGGPGGQGQSFDCSGYMGSIAAEIQGANPWQRYWATGSFAGGNTAQGFTPGLGPGFSIGLFNGGPYGGHTAGTLGAVGNYGTTNVESGGSPSMVKYGPGAVGADHGSFTHQYHLPIGADGAFVSGGAGGFDFLGAVKKWITDKLASIIDPIKDKLPSGPPAWQDIPGGVYNESKDALTGYIAEKIEGLGSLVSGVWTKITDLFDSGGVLQSGRMAMNLSGKPEAILTNSQWGKFNKMVGNMPALTESLEVIAEEISAAFNGGDWGMGELAHVLGDEKLAESIINGAAALGEISRTIGEQAQKSGTDYATTQATGALDVMGLGGLVPLGQKLGAKAWDLYQASPYEVGFNGQSVTVEIEAESDADLIRVSEFKRLADQVHGLEVKVTEKKKPLAAAVTRGGAM